MQRSKEPPEIIVVSDGALVPPRQPHARYGSASRQSYQQAVPLILVGSAKVDVQVANGREIFVVVVGQVIDHPFDIHTASTSASTWYCTSLLLVMLCCNRLAESINHRLLYEYECSTYYF